MYRELLSFYKTKWGLSIFEYFVKKTILLIEMLTQYSRYITVTQYSSGQRKPIKEQGSSI
jgi:hypothetical protein